MDTSGAFDILTIVIATIALIFSGFSFYKSYQKEIMVVVDNQLFEILQLNMQYPNFNDPSFTNNYEKSSDKKLALQYDIFAMVVWNYLELLFVYYRAKKIKKTVFWGAFEYWSELHYHWFSNPDHSSSYSQEFNKFVNHQSLHKSKSVPASSTELSI